jgi:hypothetical protein
LNRTETDVSDWARNIALNLDALAEANDQLHWGTDLARVTHASRRIEALDLNPALLSELKSKIQELRQATTPPGPQAEAA